MNFGERLFILQPVAVSFDHYISISWTAYFVLFLHSLLTVDKVSDVSKIGSLPVKNFQCRKFPQITEVKTYLCKKKTPTLCERLLT